MSLILLSATPPMAQEPVKGGEVTVALETDPTGFDAVEGGVLGQCGEIVMRTIQEPLLDYNPTRGSSAPLLAASWEVSEDQKTWTMELREGVKFHDGSDFDAEDVAHHCNRILAPDSKSRSRAFIDAIDRVEAVDAHTVEFHLKHPWQAFLLYAATTTMSGPIPSSENVEASRQNREPVGAGPFRFVSWAPGDRLVVERFEDYWAKDEINLDRVVSRIVIWTDRGQTIREAMADDRIVTLQTSGAGGEQILLNTRNTPLDDQRVRRPIGHAINQPALVKIIWQDTKPVITHPLGEMKDCGQAGYPEYDPEKAKELLAEYGQPVTLEMVHTATPRGRELGQLMQQMLKQGGVTLNLTPMDQSTLIARVFGHKFDIVGWRLPDSPDMGPQLHALVRQDSSYNLTGYGSDELDKLATAMREAEDPETATTSSATWCRRSTSPAASCSGAAVGSSPSPGPTSATCPRRSAARWT